MKNITPFYLAGVIDGEGTFTLQINLRKSSSGKENIRINPRVGIGLRYKEKEYKLLEAIKEKLKVGTIYLSNKGKETAKCMYMTTNVEDCITIAEYVLPYLYLKEKQAIRFIKICKMIKAGKLRRKGINMYGGEKIYSKEEMIEMITVATTLNEGTQMTRFRESTGRNTQYYLNIIEKLY